MTTPIFDHAHAKIIEVTFSFPESAAACKKSVHSINSFLNLVYVNLYQHAKNQAMSLICSGDMVD